MTQPLERTDLVAPGPARALAGLLDVPMPDLGAGLPLMWHWLYALERPAQVDLGADGHPIRGSVPVPPGPGRRRMWAGGRVEALAPLVAGHPGHPLTRRTRVLGEVDKSGRSGPMTLVTVEHELWQSGRMVVRERQDIIYREALVTDFSVEVAETPRRPGEWEVEISPSLLFRFSALTYNGHRIHYDRDYATGVEGYPGLVTHGPLQALCMAEAIRRTGRETSAGCAMEYRLVAPLFDHQGLFVLATLQDDGAAETAVRDRSGRQTAWGRFTPL